MSEPDFDWNDAGVDIPGQQPIAVYTNPEGHIVIRQDGDWYRKDDAWVVVLPENARRLADAILALAEPVPAPGPLALPAPADRTAAERQRRHRNAKRNGSTVTPTVTRRDAPELFEVHPPD